MAWLYQHHDYENITKIEGFDTIEETPETIEIVSEWKSNFKSLLIYCIIFLGFIFLGGPWIFYYFLLVKNNYFPMYLNYKTNVVEQGEGVVADPPPLVYIKHLYKKCYTKSTDGEKPVNADDTQLNLNVCYLNMGKSVPKGEKDGMPLDAIPNPKIRLDLNMKAYYKLFPTPISGYGDNEVSNDIILQNLFSRWFLNMCSFTLLCYFKITYVLSNISFITYFIVILSLIATISLISNFSGLSYVKHFSVISGASISYLLFTLLALLCGMYSSSAALFRFNPDNKLQDVVSLAKIDAYVFLYNFMQVFNSNQEWWPWLTVVGSGILRIGLLFLLGFLTTITSPVVAILCIPLIFYFMTQNAGVYYINNKEHPLNILHAGYIFYLYLFTCNGIVECMYLAIILFAFLIESKNLVYNGFGLSILLGSIILCLSFYYPTSVLKNNILRYMHTDSKPGEEVNLPNRNLNDELSKMFKKPGDVDGDVELTTYKSSDAIEGVNPMHDSNETK